MFYKYIGKKNKHFKFDETYRLTYLSNYDKYVCAENLIILDPIDIQDSFVLMDLLYDKGKYIITIEDKRTDDYLSFDITPLLRQTLRARG